MRGLNPAKDEAGDQRTEDPNDNNAHNVALQERNCVCNGWFHKKRVATPNGEVSDGGGHQAPESANGCRPPPFAPLKSWASWFPLNPSESIPSVNQLVVNKNAAVDDKPTTKRNFDRFACSVTALDFAPQPTADSKPFLFVLRLPIDEEALTREPSVLYTYLMAFVFNVPSLHND